METKEYTIEELVQQMLTRLEEMEKAVEALMIQKRLTDINDYKNDIGRL